MSNFKNFKTGDKIITTQGNVGEVEVVYQDVEILDPNCENFILDVTKSPSKDEYGNIVWLFLNAKEEEVFLIENAHFRFKRKYQVRFKKSVKTLNREALRLLDKDYQVITVQDANGDMKSFIIDDTHKPTEGIFKSAKIINPY